MDQPGFDQWSLGRFRRNWTIYIGTESWLFRKPGIWNYRTTFGSDNRVLERWADLLVGLVPRRPFPIMPCRFTEAW